MQRNLRLDLVFLALVLLALSGCSVFTIGYNHADTYLRYTIHDYTSFDAAQKSQIRQEVDTYMRWHRKEMLPEYIDFLKAVKKSTQTNSLLTAVDVARLRLMVKTLYIHTLQPAITPTAHLLSGLSRTQIDELKTSFAENIAKQRKKDLAGSMDERLKHRAEKTIDYLEDLVGGFSETQLANLRGMSYGLPYASDLYLRYRELQQASLVALLNEQATEIQVADFLNKWVIQPETARSAQDQQTILTFENESDQFIAEVYGMLTEHQRKTFQKNIDKYIGIFQKLSAPH